MLAAALLALTALLYWPVTGFPFLQIDDNPRLLQQDLSKTSLAWAFSNAFAWQPLAWLSHEWDFRLFGFQNAANHHLINLLLHLANVALFAWFLAKLTGERGASLMAAALFAWHPLRAEPVAWVSARGELLAALFVLLALEAHRRGRWREAIPLGALGMMASPAAAPIAVLLYLLDRLVLHRPVNRIESGALGLLGIATLILRATSGPDHEALLATVPALQGLGAMAGPALAALWPLGLSIARVPGTLALAGIAALAAVAAIIALVREPLAKWGAAWFLLLLIPSALLPAVWGWSDSATYLPHLGLSMALVWIVPRVSWPLAAKCAVILLVGWITLCWAQLHRFQGTIPLLEQAIAVNPANVEARLGLAMALAAAGNPAAAEPHFAIVTKARPDTALGWVGYARVLTSQRRPAEALQALDQGLRHVPKSAEARFERGIALQNLNRVPEAEQSFIDALNLGLDPRTGAIAYNNIGTYAAQRQEIAKAERYFEQAFKLDLGFALAHRNYAMTLVAQNQRAKAINHLEKKAILWTNNDRMVGEYLSTLMTQSYAEQYKKEQEAIAAEKAAERKAALKP